MYYVNPTFDFKIIAVEMCWDGFESGSRPLGLRPLPAHFLPLTPEKVDNRTMMKELYTIPADENRTRFGFDSDALVNAFVEHFGQVRIRVLSSTLRCTMKLDAQGTHSGWCVCLPCRSGRVRVRLPPDHSLTTSFWDSATSPTATSTSTVVNGKASRSSTGCRFLRHSSGW